MPSTVSKTENFRGWESRIQFRREVRCPPWFRSAGAARTDESDGGKAFDICPVVVADGAVWIRDVSDKVLCQKKDTYVVEFFHAADYSRAALKRIRRAPEELREQFDNGKSDLKEGRAAQFIAS